MPILAPQKDWQESIWPYKCLGGNDGPELVIQARANAVRLCYKSLGTRLVLLSIQDNTVYLPNLLLGYMKVELIEQFSLQVFECFNMYLRTVYLDSYANHHLHFHLH